MPTGDALSDLPPYPWDHHRSHWSESRIAREWRMRKHQHHDLLGAKIPDTTGLQPTWRNLLHVESAPWLRDHKINEDLIFPFAGYIAMAAEAIRQITSVEEAVEFRNVAVCTALVLDGSSSEELVTSFLRLRLTDALESEWWGFIISSHNGKIQALQAENPAQHRVATPKELPRKASSARLYDTMRREGLGYGHHFKSLFDITTTTIGARMASARVDNNWHGDEHFYHLHPVILDSYFQLLSIAARHGLASNYELVVSATAAAVGSGVHGIGAVTAGDQSIIEVSDVRLAFFKSLDVDESISLAARSEWVSHVESETLGPPAKPTKDIQAHAASLNELVSLAIAATRQATVGLDVVPELQQYKKG
jgi:acyl transferase domain-containing protein